MPRGWTTYLLITGFAAGVGLCLVSDVGDNHHGSRIASTATYSVQFCEASVVSCGDQSGSQTYLLASSVGGDQKSFYEGVSLAPPVPPPRE